MIERIRELDNNQIDSLKSLGRDALSAISPPIASMVYSDNPDQLTALNNLGPSTLRIVSPQLADMLYGDDGYGGSATGTYGDDLVDGGSGLGRDIIDPDTAEKGLGRFPGQPPIILPPMPIPEYVVWWAFDDACPVCLDNADDPPRPYGEPFSSGDVSPPAHDHCRCGLEYSMRGNMHGYRSGVFELSSRF